ncbi:Rieske (2Fe-2S) protein [Mucilaginibacter sp.]|uniref:Rieske (2Fe-2S) protein n=1 Tax=Mucilaginibacter sp. TaxID=1882438 RepID=UPI003D136625
MRWYKIPGIQNTDQPFIKKVKAGNKTVCLIGYEGSFYALSAVCPHAGADLSNGWCNNQKLICPFHRYSYDLRTGKGSGGQNDYISSFPVKVKDDIIYIGINTFWERIKQAFK